jgi:UDP-N-acetylmuramoyl-L-alanyl-D-glutamate--2,6-diaminopimelate ligase
MADRSTCRKYVSPSVRVALGPLAARFFGSPSQSMRVLGVTGTNGKTTTTYLLEAIANAAGDRTGVIGTVSARVGTHTLPSVHTTPEATELQSTLAAMRDDDCRDGRDGGVFARAPPAPRRRDHILPPPASPISRTIISTTTVRSSVLRAKARLFTPEFTRRAAVHVGDDHGARLAQQAKERGLDVIRFAIDDPDVEVSARDVC